MDYLAANNVGIIDLSTSEIEMEELSEDLILDRLGGVGVTTYLYDRFRGEEPIIFGTGLLTGTLVPGSSLGVITAQDPLTKDICHAPFCLDAAIEMKYAGFDYIVVKGVSDDPVYLWLHDGIADICSATSYWGKTPWEVVDIKTGLRHDLGEELIQFLTIGKAGEVGSSIAQIMVNCWGSGDRWGFGKILGEKRLKCIAMRGMGLFEIADPNGFIIQCAELLKGIKKGQALSRRGCVEFAAALGEEDLREWVAPFIHRHSADFNCPYPTNTFVKYKEDAKILEETDIEEPGFLITDIYSLLGFKRMGLPAEDAFKMLEACSRYGLEPVAASRILGETGEKDLESLLGELPELKPLESAPSRPFSSWIPPKPIFADFGLPADGSEDSNWWKRRQALAHIFGLHPVFMLMCPELSESKLMELVKLGTSLEIQPETVDAVITEVCR